MYENGPSKDSLLDGARHAEMVAERHVERCRGTAAGPGAWRLRVPVTPKLVVGLAALAAVVVSSRLDGTLEGYFAIVSVTAMTLLGSERQYENRSVRSLGPRSDDRGRST